jgi:CheY-like chemotaxis protein
MDQFGKSQKIIIVEDNASLAEIYKTRLEVLGYEVLVAYDGITALNLIQHEQPNLVLLDLMVPKIAGDQILETMRKNDWGKDIPVVIISNLNEADAPAGIRGMGISGYAIKANLSNDQLDQLVDSILMPPTQEGGASLDAQPNPVETAQPTPVDTPEPTPVETPEPNPADNTQPIPVDTSEPNPEETQQPEHIETGQPNLDVQPDHVQTEQPNQYN